MKTLLCLLWLRIDQRVELLGPIGVDVCEDCVLLEGGVAVAHREESLAEIVVGSSRNRASDGLIAETIPAASLSLFNSR